MAIVIITPGQILDLLLKTGDAGPGYLPPTTREGDDAVGGRAAQERSLEDSALAALGLRRFDPRKPEPDEGWAPPPRSEPFKLPAVEDPVAALATDALGAAYFAGVCANDDRADVEQDRADVARGALMIGIGMLRAGQLPAPHQEARFYSITTSHGDPADGANMIPRDHRVVLVEPLGDLGYRYLIEKPVEAPPPRSTSLERFDRAVAAHGATTALLKSAGDHFLKAWGHWINVSAEKGAADLMAGEGWELVNTPDAGWTVKRRADTYLWETDASALGFVRERAPAVALHQAAVNLVDAQLRVAAALGIGGPR